MQKIKQIVSHIRAELHDADEYSREAALIHTDDRQLSDLYVKLANEEIAHAHLQHEQAVRIIKAYKDEGKEVPAAMQAVWDWEHAQMIDDEARVKMRLASIK